MPKVIYSSPSIHTHNLKPFSASPFLSALPFNCMCLCVKKMSTRTSSRSEMSRWETHTGSKFLRCSCHGKWKKRTQLRQIQPQVKLWRLAVIFYVTRSINPSDWKMDFNNFLPTPFSITFHFHFLFHRFWRVVYQEWSSSNTEELLIIKTQWSTVSTSNEDLAW